MATCIVVSEMTSLMFTGLIVQDGTATGVPQSGTGSTSEGTQEDREQDTPTTVTDVPPSGTGSTSTQASKQDPPTTDDVTNKERDTSRRGFSEVILSVWSVWWGLPPSSLSALLSLCRLW